LYKRNWRQCQEKERDDEAVLHEDAVMVEAGMENEDTAAAVQEECECL
jgi:hypothetical protein